MSFGNEIIAIETPVTNFIEAAAPASLANTFHTMLNATINGDPVVDGIFITSVGKELSGEVFAERLPGEAIYPDPKGIQFEAHISPFNGDEHIIEGLPIQKQAPSDAITAAKLLDRVPIDANTKYVMLGGHMAVVGEVSGFFNELIKRVEAVSEEPSERPTILLTAASQSIAGSAEFHEAFERATAVSKVFISANTGEFRRLMGMDTEWRKKDEAKWWVNPQGISLHAYYQTIPSLLDPNTKEGRARVLDQEFRRLAGEALDKAKAVDVEYQRHKLLANYTAYRAAYDKYVRGKKAPATFVITNDGKGVHVVNRMDGLSDNYAVPDGVINTPGAWDRFLAGYLIGEICGGLQTEQCVELGFVCSGKVIGVEKARLPSKTLVFALEDKEIELGGALAYLKSTRTHRNIVKKMVGAMQKKDMPSSSSQDPQPKCQPGRPACMCRNEQSPDVA